MEKPEGYKFQIRVAGHKVTGYWNGYTVVIPTNIGMTYRDASTIEAARDQLRQVWEQTT